MLVNVFTKFRNVCFDIFELDPAHFLSPPGLAWQVCLKKSNVNLELTSDVDMLLMIEKRIRGVIFRLITNISMKNIIKLKNQHIFNIMMLIACTLEQ